MSIIVSIWYYNALFGGNIALTSLAVEIIRRPALGGRV